MVIPITLLSLLENLIIGILFGVSTVAVISYALSLRYGFPTEGVGNHLIKTIYTLLRLFHICILILVSSVFLLYGIFDSISDVQIEYGIKFFVLLVNAFVAYGMAKHFFQIKYFAPVMAAGWYFLATFHSYALFLSVEQILTPLIIYAGYIVIFEIIFKVLPYIVKPVKTNEETDSTDNV